MKVTVLSSGSKGNATLIESKNKNILIDAGITLKDLESRINKDNIKIDIIFITHAHGDHTKGLRQIYKEYKPIVYTRNQEIINKGLCPTTYLEDYLIIDDLEITTFNLSHDSDCVGFKIKNAETNKELIYITDTGYINRKILTQITNKDVYIMESNHDVEMLRNGKYPFILQQRILSDKGHLSNEDCCKYLSRLIGNNTSYIILAHLSEENNTEEIARGELQKMLIKNHLNIKNICAKQKERIETIEV